MIKSLHNNSWTKLKASSSQWIAMLLFVALCVSFVYDYHAMNLEIEIELVEGEDNSTEENNKKEKKEIELIEGMISALSNGVRFGNRAATSRMLKGEYIDNILTPPPELI